MPRPLGSPESRRGFSATTRRGDRGGLRARGRRTTQGKLNQNKERQNRGRRRRRRRRRQEDEEEVCLICGGVLRGCDDSKTLFRQNLGGGAYSLRLSRQGMFLHPYSCYRQGMFSTGDVSASRINVSASRINVPASRISVSN